MKKSFVFLLIFFILFTYVINSHAIGIIIIMSGSPNTGSGGGSGGSCTTSNDTSIISQTSHGGEGTAATTTDWRAQQISISSTTTITQIDVWIIDDGATGDLRLALYNDSSGSPGTAITNLSKDVSNSSITNSAGGALVSFIFDTPTQVTAGTYHIVMYGVGTSASFKPFYNTVESGGNLEYSSNSGSSWSNYTTGDYYYNVFGCTNAANAYYDPNATASTGDWSNSDENQTNLHTYVDDGTTADDANFILAYAPDPATVVEFSFPEVTGTVNTVRAHIRMKYGNATNGNEAISISRDGTNWSSYVDIGNITNAYANYTVDFTSLSWDGTTDFRCRIRSNVNFSEWTYISRIRLEVNP